MRRIHKNKRQEQSWGTSWSGHKRIKAQPSTWIRCEVSPQSTHSQGVLAWVGLTGLLLSFDCFCFVPSSLCQNYAGSRKHSRDLLFLLKTWLQLLLHKISWISTEHITVGVVSICPHLDVCNADVLLWAASRFLLHSIQRKGTFRAQFIS